MSFVSWLVLEDGSAAALSRLDGLLAEVDPRSVGAPESAARRGDLPLLDPLLRITGGEGALADLARTTLHEL